MKGKACDCLDLIYVLCDLNQQLIKSVRNSEAIKSQKSKKYKKMENIHLQIFLPVPYYVP